MPEPATRPPFGRAAAPRGSSRLRAALPTSRLALAWAAVCLTLGAGLWSAELASSALDPRRSHARPASSQALAVVMPFIDCQLGRLTKNLRAWRKYPPCTQPPESVVTLVFYYNRDLEAAHEVREQVQQLWAGLGAAQRCFTGGVQLMSARLSAREDTYPIGTCLQFHRAFPALRALGFEHWFLMEPDTTPIQPDWVARLAALVAHNQRCSFFWQLGTVPSFKNETHDVKHLAAGEVYNPDTHLNGNSLYCLADAGFDEFLERVQNASRHGFCGEVTFGYDFAMWRFRNDHMNRGYMNFRFSKFVVSDFIVNYDTHPYDLPQLQREHPQVVLVHAKGAADLCSTHAAAARKNEVLVKHGPPLPAACSLPLYSIDFQTIDYSFMLLGAARAAAPQFSGVELTSLQKSQVGHVLVDAAYDACAASTDSLLAQFVARAGNGTKLKPRQLADGMSFAFINASAPSLRTTKSVVTSGVVVPDNALAVVMDEYDNGDGQGIYIVSTRNGTATRLAKARQLPKRWMAGQPVAVRIQVFACGTRGASLSLTVDGHKVFTHERLHATFPAAFYVAVSANTGGKAQQHHLHSAQLCRIDGPAV